MNLIKQRLKALRTWLTDHAYHACIIPQTDPHLSEYVEEYDKARVYFSGFTGSAGTLVVTLKEAALFTDSRYYVQAEQQLAETGIDWCKSDSENEPTLPLWLSKRIEPGQKVAANAYYFAHKEWQALEQTVTIEHQNQFESLWQERPSLSKAPCVLYQGPTLTCQEKIAKLRQAMQQQAVDACFVTALDDIAWLLNIRGGDVAYVPVVRSYLWVDSVCVKWWVDSHKITPPVAQYLVQNNIQVCSYQQIEQDLQAMTPAQRVWVDAGNLNQRIHALLQAKYTLFHKTLWITEAKACKTLPELQAIEQVMVYDAVAWVRTLKWLHTKLADKELISELDFKDALIAFKKQHPLYLDESFEPIVAYGAHGAIVHYEATKQSNIPILPQGFLLVDAGSHYQYGTTDVTRTIACGAITEQQKQVYTAVLQGMISLAEAQFTNQTPSAQLDSLARQPLKEMQLDYGHGTGHGIGTVLSVHEAGARISPKSVKPLQVGMVLSDEPGCYLKDQFGVRIENMVAVKASKSETAGNEVLPLHFQVLTCIPLDCSAIDVSMLSNSQIAWINAYHRQVCQKVEPFLTTQEYNWLKTYVYEI